MFLSCSPFSAAKCHGKNPACQWFKGGDFFAPFAKKYYPSIDRLDRCNGQKKDCHVAIPFLCLLFFGMYWRGVEGFKQKPNTEPETIHKVFKSIG